MERAPSGVCSPRMLSVLEQLQAAGRIRCSPHIAVRRHQQRAHVRDCPSPLVRPHSCTLPACSRCKPAIMRADPNAPGRIWRNTLRAPARPPFRAGHRTPLLNHVPGSANRSGAPPRPSPRHPGRLNGTDSNGSPDFVVITSMARGRNRFNPPPVVPTQRLPSRSSVSAEISGCDTATRLQLVFSQAQQPIRSRADPQRPGAIFQHDPHRHPLRQPRDQSRLGAFSVFQHLCRRADPHPARARGRRNAPGRNQVSAAYSSDRHGTRPLAHPGQTIVACAHPSPTRNSRPPANPLPRRPDPPCRPRIRQISLPATRQTLPSLSSVIAVTREPGKPSRRVEDPCRRSTDPDHTPRDPSPAKVAPAGPDTFSAH